MNLGDILVDVQGVAKHYGQGETRVDALRSVAAGDEGVVRAFARQLGL